MVLPMLLPCETNPKPTFCPCHDATHLFSLAGQVLQFEDWMKEEKVNLQKCLPSKERILRMAAYNRIVRSFRSSHFTEELQAHKMWRITNLLEHYDPVDAPRVPEYKGQFPMFVLPEAGPSKTDAPGESHVGLNVGTAGTGDDRVFGQDSQGPRVKADSKPEIQEFQEQLQQPAESSRRSVQPSRLDHDGHPEVKDADADSAAGELEGICVVCIEKSALFVMQCGHLIFCPGCRRKAVAKELRESGKTQWKSVKPGQLSNKELERTKVRCPICREESVAVAQKKFSGKVYT